MKITNKVMDDIFTQMASGKTLTAICRKAGYPSRIGVLKKIQNDEDLGRRYEIARQQLADFWFDKIESLSKTVTAENFQAKRIEIDALKWICSKLNTRYSDGPMIDQSQHVHLSSNEAKKLDQINKRAMIHVQQMKLPNSPEPDVIDVSNAMEYAKTNLNGKITQ